MIMLYKTNNKGYAEVGGYDKGRKVSGYYIRYDDANIPDEYLANDDAFSDWVLDNNAKYCGTQEPKIRR